MNFISKFCKGLFARGTADNCPPNYITQADQLMSKEGNLRIRPGLVKLGVGVTKSSVSHMSVYQPNPVAGVVTESLIVHRGLSNNPIFDITSFPGTQIFLPAADSTYHSWINFFGRGYFTLHNTKVASNTDKVQVYENTGTTRNICGLKPVSAMASAAVGGGNLGVGKYLFDVVYVTSSGFITKPSGSVTNADCFGSYKVNHTVIPTGPAGTVARMIIMTKAISLGTYTGNPNDYEFFFEPNGLINDNVTTTHTTSEFDGNLVRSADYLLNNLESVASGLGIGEYASRMLVWGERANPSIIRVSKVGEPESFDSINGVIVVDPSESGGVTNCIVLRGTLYITKNNKMYYTIDNGRDPSTWEVKTFDSGIGTTCYGASAVLDNRGTHLNQFIIAGRSGLVLFDGLVRSPDLTYWIEDIWRDITSADFSTTSIQMNPIDKHIYVCIKRSDGLFYILFGDYSEGLDSDNIKWFLWLGTISVPNGLVHLIVLTDSNGVPQLYVSDGVGLYTISFSNPADIDQNHAGSDTAISAVIKTPVIVNGQDDGFTQQVNTVRMRIKMVGSNAPTITAQGVSAADSAKVGAV